MVLRYLNNHLFNKDGEDLMIKIIKNNRGDIATPILTILGVITIVAFLVLTFEKLVPAVTYINANQIVRKYMLVMENEGGLSKEHRAKMIGELKQKGVNVDETSISAPVRVPYGEDLTLTLAYNYKYSELALSGFDIKRTEKTMPMRISRSTVSRCSKDIGE